MRKTGEIGYLYCSLTRPAASASEPAASHELWPALCRRFAASKGLIAAPPPAICEGLGYYSVCFVQAFWNNAEMFLKSLLKQYPMSQ